MHVLLIQFFGLYHYHTQATFCLNMGSVAELGTFTVSGCA
jgi:hypothetical protein